MEEQKPSLKDSYCGLKKYSNKVNYWRLELVCINIKNQTKTTLLFSIAT